MVAPANTISHGSISINYITRMGKAEIIKLNHLPHDVEVQAWWAHMVAHQMAHRDKRSKHRPLKDNMIRIEISPAREETAGWSHADWERLADDFIKAYDAVDLSGMVGRKSASYNTIANSQYVISLHRDSKSGIVHMHLDCNRVDMDGNVNDAHKIGVRATMAANEVNRQRGWVQSMQRSEENKQRLADDCMATLSEMKQFSWDDYVKKMGAKGHDVRLKHDSNGQVRGYTVRMGNSIYKSSELGRGRNLMPSKILSTWQKLHPVPTNQVNRPFYRPMEAGRSSFTSHPQVHIQAESSPNVFCIQVDKKEYVVKMPERAYEAVQEEIRKCDVDKDTTENTANVAMLLFANYIDAATSMSESCGGGGSAPTSGWGKDKDDDWEWAKRCAQMAHSMVTTPKSRIKRGRGR